MTWLDVEAVEVSHVTGHLFLPPFCQSHYQKWQVPRLFVITSTSNQHAVRPSCLVTVGEWSFDSAGTKLWNSRCLHHWQCFDQNWKQIYFGSHIWTLLCNLFVVVLAIVVLAVNIVSRFNCSIELNWLLQRISQIDIDTRLLVFLEINY